MTTELLRYAAFADQPAGGNPAGVVLDARALDDAQMLAIAAQAGYSESVFLRKRGEREYDVRYFSPQAEVAFCGHATVAGAVALADRIGAGPLRFHTAAGVVPVEVEAGPDGPRATLTSVEPAVLPAPRDLVDDAMSALRWRGEDLDPQLPPRIAYAGVRHLVLAARTRERLRRLDYDFAALRDAMTRHALTTVALVWQEDGGRFHARNPFPVGGVVEDPATGAAAAAFGAYLRELGRVAPPATVTILQGEDMGRPSVLTVDIGASGGIRVSGRAVAISDPGEITSGSRC